MRYREGLLICTSILSALTIISLNSSTVKAADDKLAEAKIELNLQVPTNDETDALNKIASNVTLKTATDPDQQADTNDQTQQTNTAGGNWQIAPDDATAQDNLYNSVNAKWEETTPISDNGFEQSYSDELGTKALHDTKDYLDGVAKGTSTTDIPQIQQAADFYRRYVEMLTSDQVNVGSLKDDIQKVESFKDYQDLNHNLVELSQDGFAMPFALTQSPVLNDNTKMQLQLKYQIGNLPIKENNLLNLQDEMSFKAAMTQLLDALDVEPDKADQMVKNAIAFEELLNNKSTSSSINIGNDTTSPIDFLNNLPVLKLSNFYQAQDNLDLQGIISQEYPQANNIQLSKQTDMALFNQIFSRPNFDLVKDWLSVKQVWNNRQLFGKLGQTAFNNSGLLVFMTTDNNGHTSAESNAITPEEKAFSATEQYFSDSLSMLYGMNHLSEASRNEVRTMVEKIRDAYKTRLENNNWLSDSTKKMAIDKLNKMVIKVGYPTTIPANSDFTDVKFSPNESLYDIKKALNRAYLDKSKILSDTRNDWTKSSYEFNSFYYAQSNSIEIHASMLQAPIFSLDQSVSKNYGGIGTIIGHEITHAFDSTGSQFDAQGNQSNWWTKADSDEFKKLSQKMIDEYDGITFDWGTVNGSASVDENIADNGGMAVALQVAKQDQSFDAQEFFDNWAKCWRIKVLKDAQPGLLLDAHAPYPIRVNVVAQNQPEFYDAFNVVKGDGMWLDPDQRVEIW